MSFEGKTVVITGAARGIGRAIAYEFAKNKANIVINYHGNEAGALETKKTCEELGANAIICKADVAKDEDCKCLIDTAMESYGRVDVLVNNAGITKDKLMMAMKEEDFDQVINANLKGTFLCTKYATKIMMKQRYGRVINLSSVVGLRGNAGQVNYSASKAGIIGLTKSAAKELATRNITVNAIAPGMIETDMTNVLPDKIKDAMLSQIPVARVGTGEDIANAVLFFADEKASYVTGQVICVDGGMAI